MSLLNYADQLKAPADFEDLLPDVSIKADEMRLSRTLIESTSTDEVDLSQYKDTYTHELREVVEAKVSGQQVVAVPDDEEVPVVNLMDAPPQRGQKPARPSRQASEESRSRDPHVVRGAPTTKIVVAAKSGARLALADHGFFGQPLQWGALTCLAFEIPPGDLS